MRVKSFDSTRVFCWRASNLEVYNNMECGILLFLLPLLLTHLLLVRAADDAVDSTQVKAGNVSTVNECYWSGEGPICDGKCRAGETVVSESKKNDGNGCIIGKKMYCCKGGAVLSNNNGTEPVALHHVKRQHVIEVTNSSSTQGQLLLEDTKDDCYWVGKSPNCKGSCLEGDYMVNTSRTANGSTCIVGKKKYCCKGSDTNNTLNDVHTHSGSSSIITTEAAPVKQMTNGNSSSCYWMGKAPICLGSCKFGDYVADKSPTGDGGGKCESGQKKFCCARQQSTAPVSTEEPPPPLKTTTSSSIGQMDNVNNSISNWTSARPFQARRRPTPRGLPINSIVTNRVKIVKIKRKLVMSTPTAANVSTSISMTSETSSTLAMDQSLLTLPSTTESTVTTTATAPLTTTESTTATTAATTTPSTTTASATTTAESTTTATAAKTPSATTASTTTPSTTESTTPTTVATITTTATPTTATTTTESTTTPSTTTTQTESTATATATTSSTPIRHPIRHPTRHPTTLATTTTTATPTTSTATTTPSTTTASATTTTESTTTTPTESTTTTPSTTIASTTESTTPTTATTTPSTTATSTESTTTTPTTTPTTTTPTTTTATATTTTKSTTLASTTATTTTTESTTTTPTASMTKTTESTTTATATMSSTSIQSTTLAARSTSTATESTSLATGPSIPASSSIKPTPARAPKKFEPFFNLPDVLPVPLIFRIQKSADTDITSLNANIATTSIIQSSTTSTTPTTLE